MESAQMQLRLLEGEWERIEGNIRQTIVIKGNRVKYHEYKEEDLGWRDDLNKWVITGGMTVWQLGIENGNLTTFAPKNGPFSPLTLLYSRVK